MVDTLLNLKFCPGALSSSFPYISGTDYRATSLVVHTSTMYSGSHDPAEKKISFPPTFPGNPSAYSSKTSLTIKNDPTVTI